jgi:predicted lipid-binding transport protein (Tim44 family)
MLRFRPVFAVIALAGALALAATDAMARPGGGGSRGSRTYSAPPATTTAPTAKPIERSMTQPGQPGYAQRPQTSSPLGGFFNRPGFLGGLFAGFLGAGLLGMLFGHGLFGGLGGLASIIGLVLQIALIVIVARLLWSWWQRRNQPALASGPSLHNVSPLSGLGLGGGAGAAATAPRQAGTDEVGLTSDDFNEFEKLLGQVQATYSQEDLGALRSLATPEVVSYFSEDLAANASKGVVNRISDVKLLQGDLSEAWREGDTEYATVAMRYSLNDETVERASGRVVSGGADQATEIWTFMRRRGGQWLLSAIQQT